MYSLPRCPVCGSSATGQLLRRESVPVHQNLLMPDGASARSLARGCLDMRYCTACEFVYNGAFDASMLSYGQQYDNTQTHSAAFQEYVADLVRHLLDDCQVRNCQLIEIGCGKGDFLRRLVADPSANNRGRGFDPTYVGPAEDCDGRLRFEKTFYDESQRDIAADVVICRHVIEHVADPVKLLKSVRAALGARPARVYFETPCVEWILNHEVVWDFFYEHCSLFTKHSLRSAFELAGFAVHNVRHVFGGQYLWLEAETSEIPTYSRPNHGSLALLAESFAQREQQTSSYWLEQVGKLASSDQVALWGAGAKGVTFANLIDPDASLIRCVVDVNPAKQGHFLPGTGHPIVAPEQLDDLNISAAIVLNPNYTTEIQRQLALRGLQVTLCDLMAN